MELTRQDVARARSDLGAFGEMVGWPLTAVQLGALTLEERMTVLVAPRQTGKSRSLALLATWFAFGGPKRRVLVVSAGEEASRRLLASVREVAAHPLLAGSVLDEGLSLVQLSNGSEVRSVPASERQIRGWAVDLLIVDEAALVPDDVLLSAALPTTAARPDARIVLASTPWATEGAFYRLHLTGLEAGGSTRTVRWSIDDAPWITPEVIEHARATLPPLRFSAEFEGQFVGAADAFFPPSMLRAAAADYRLLPPDEADGGDVVVGLDWGRAFDRHAVVCVGVLDDHGANHRPVLFVPWLETSTRSYGEQVDVVASIARRPGAEFSIGPNAAMRSIFGMGRTAFTDGRWHTTGAYLPRFGHPRNRRRPGYDVLGVVTELNGVGAFPSEELTRRLEGAVRHVRVRGIHSSQKSKEGAYGRLRALLDDRRLVLPDDPDLLRQLGGLAYEATASGGLSIAASSPSIHDDLADALSLAVTEVPLDADAGQPTAEPPGCDFVMSGAGVFVPRDARPRPGAFRDLANTFTSY